MAYNPFCPLPLPPVPIPCDFSCLKQPCPSSSPLSKELDLHGFLDKSFQYHFHHTPDPLFPLMLENQVGKNGFWAPQSPALHPCTVSVPWVLFFLGYSWCEDNLHILLYYLELDPHFGGKKKKSQANQWWSSILWWCCDNKFKAFFETAVLGINQSMCQSVVPLTFL